MAVNLHNRHFLTLLDYTPKEIEFLLDLSFKLKKDKNEGTETQKQKWLPDLAQGKVKLGNIAHVFSVEVPFPHMTGFISHLPEKFRIGNFTVAKMRLTIT